MALAQNEAARAWRERRGLSRKVLSDMTGYSVEAIKQLESGRNRATGNPLPAAVWNRYRNACAGAVTDPAFDW